ncbi:MAG: hypothetical protein OEL66_09310, partial [Desulfobulbaceae bacterium]|nr:hypothetical protein [Desulfobulbaceae bacterium]
SPETAKAGSPVEDDSASEGGGATLAPDVSEGAVDAASSPVNADNGYFRPLFFEKMPRPRPIRNPAARRLPKTIGIDIQPTSLSFVKVSVSGDRAKVHDFRHLPLDGEASSGQSGFEAFLENSGLRKTLQKELEFFCDEPKPCDIWCSLPRDLIEIHHLSIPPVPPGEVANAIYWATKKHTTFDEKSTIVDFTLLSDGDPGGKKNAIVFLAPRQTVFALRELFDELGYPLCGVTTSSIGFQNQIRQGWVTVPDSFALLHVEEQSSFIDMFHQGVWIFGREIKTGLKSFIDSIIEQADSHGETIDEHTAQKILFGGEVPPHASGESIDDDVLALEEEAAAIDDLSPPAAERLVRQLERTFDYCVTTFGTPRATKIYIAGQPAASRLFIDNVGAESGLECVPADPYAVSSHLLRYILPPDDPKQSCVMHTAFGLAFAKPFETQNFLNTYQKRTDAIQTIRFNKVVFGGSAVIALIICILFAFQYYHISKGDRELADLEKQLIAANTTFDNKINTANLLQSAQKIQAGRSARNALAKKYYQLGLVGEITRLLPERIKLVRLTIEPADAGRRSTTAKSNTVANNQKRAVLEGVVFGEEQSREFVMSGLLQQLAGSPLVKDASFVQKQTAVTGGETVLLFTAAITPTPMVMSRTEKAQARMNP